MSGYEEEREDAGRDGEDASSKFKDETIDCKDCGAEFIHSARDQAFYEEKGFDNKPARCRSCKGAKKDRMNGGGGGGGGDRSRGGGGGGGGDCYAFKEGRCDRGSSCRFSHGGGGGGGGGGYDRGGSSRGGYERRDDRGGGGDRPRGGGGSCYAFKEGKCDRGSSCRFSHD